MGNLPMGQAPEKRKFDDAALLDGDLCQSSAYALLLKRTLIHAELAVLSIELSTRISVAGIGSRRPGA